MTEVEPKSTRMIEPDVAKGSTVHIKSCGTEIAMAAALYLNRSFWLTYFFRRLVKPRAWAADLLASLGDRNGFSCMPHYSRLRMRNGANFGLSGRARSIPRLIKQRSIPLEPSVRDVSSRRPSRSVVRTRNRISSGRS